MTVAKDQRIAALEACKNGLEAMLCDGQERIAQLEHAIDKVIETKILEKGAFVLNPGMKRALANMSTVRWLEEQG